MCDHTKFQPNNIKTDDCSQCSTDNAKSQWTKCRPGNTKNGGTVLPIANLMADSESASPDSYSSFLVAIRLSRQVSEIFISDRQTDRQTTRIITIACPHTVAGQLNTGNNCSIQLALPLSSTHAIQAVLSLSLRHVYGTVCLTHYTIQTVVSLR